MARGLDLAEHLEDACQVLLGDADPGVLHRDDDARRRRATAVSTIRPLAGVYFAELISRLENTCASRVRSPSSGQPLVRQAQRRARARKRRSAAARSRRPARSPCARSMPLHPQRQLAPGQPRDVEQVVEQPRHLLGLPADDAVAPGDLGIARLEMAQHVDGVADRRQRIAQLVRQGGDEVVLLLVGDAQDLLGLLALADVHDDAEGPHRPALLVVFGLAAVADPDVAAVGAADPELVEEGLALGDRLGASAREAVPIVGMEQVDDALARRHELGAVDAEQLVGLGRPPQRVRARCRARTRPSARRSAPGEAARARRAACCSACSRLGDVGHDADEAPRPARRRRAPSPSRGRTATASSRPAARRGSRPANESCCSASSWNRCAR